MATVTQKVSKSLRTGISNKINSVPLNYYNKTSIGDVLSRVTNDVDMIGQTMNQSVGTLVSAVTMFIGSLIMMLVTNWIMAITAVLATAIGFVLMMLIMSRSQKYFIRQQSELGKINGHIEEIYSGHNVVKVYNGVEKAEEKFESINDRLYDSAWKSQFMSGLMMPLMNFIGNFGYVCVCIVGAALFMHDHITFGVIVAFMIYIRLSLILFHRLLRLQLLYSQLPQPQKECLNFLMKKKWKMKVISLQNWKQLRVMLNLEMLNLVMILIK